MDMSSNMGLPLGDFHQQLAALSLQTLPYQAESSSTSAQVHGSSSIVNDSIVTQAYNPMLGAEKLFAGMAQQQSVFSRNTNMFTFACNNHPSPKTMSSRSARPEDIFPPLLAGSVNGPLKTSSATCTQPCCLSGNISLGFNESASAAGPSSNTGNELPRGTQHYQPRIDREFLNWKLGKPEGVPEGTERGAPTKGKSILTGKHSETKQPTYVRRVLGAPSRPAAHFSNDVEIFARKVFVGGLPIDVTEEEIWQTFSVFGKVLVDWPRRPDGVSHRDEESGRPSRTMTGYVFLVFEEEKSVQYLVNECHKEDDRYYLFVSSPTMRDKPVQVRPWRLADMDFITNPDAIMDPRTTVFIGGVPRPTKASELAECLQRLYGPVCYVGIDIDPELKYPKGAARVTFVTTQAFIAAINGRFVHLHHGDTQKRVEIKPYVMDEQMCDNCEGKQCSSRYAPYFCPEVDCLQYYCEFCWDHIHYRVGSRRTEHRPLVRMGDQNKILPRPPHHNSRTSRGLIGSNHSRHYYT